MKRILAFVFFMIILASCQNIEKTPKPDDLIPEGKMVKVLTDISLLHGARTYNRKLMKDKGISPYAYLWEKYKIDSSQFRRSNDFYSENYKQYQRIYDSVKRRLEVMQVQYDSLREREERRQDSINALDTTAVREKAVEDSLLFKEDSIKMLPRPVSAGRDSITFSTQN
jgi:hypothetical protein